MHKCHFTVSCCDLCASINDLDLLVVVFLQTVNNDDVVIGMAIVGDVTQLNWPISSVSAM